MFNRSTINDAHGPRAVIAELPIRWVIDMVLESVHPANLGPLPPSPEFILRKAVQIGLLKSVSEGTTSCTLWHRNWSNEANDLAPEALRRSFYCI